MKRNGKRQTSMDKFIVRSPQKSPACSPTKDRSGMRQATLESLRGVVVVEEMERAVVVLERSDVSLELKVDTLKHLLNKNPAKKVLIRTGLGKTVHKLCRSEDAKIAAAAQRVYRTWKKHILSKVNRPYIEVKCDLRTQRLRNSARQMLSEALQREDKEGGGGGEGEDGGGSRDRKKTNESQKRSWSGGESLSSERKKDIQEEEEKKEGKSEGVKGHKRTEEDSDRKRDEGKRKKKKEKEKEESERKHKKEGGERSHTQRKEEGEEKAQKRKRQESERQEKEGKEQKDKAKGEEENSEPTSQDSQQDSSSSSLSMEGLAEHIEREVYHSSKRSVDNSYRRTVRALVFTLRHQGDVRKTVSLATLSVPDFVKQYRKS